MASDDVAVGGSSAVFVLRTYHSPRHPPRHPPHFKSLGLELIGKRERRVIVNEEAPGFRLGPRVNRYMTYDML